MSDTVIQQVILRKENDSAPSGKTVKRMVETRGISVVDEKPSSLLIEGDEAAIKSATQSIKGWRSFPTRRYSVPDTKVKAGR
ncbi:hypothetical protein GOL22_27220 [Sinorhizobium medicae]|nr:hypothetical protein [Sinorhizobium medicae]